MGIRRLVIGTAGAVTLAASATLGAGLVSASADTVPAADCRVDCTTTFDTPGTHDLAVPAGITSLTVTLAGAAGATADEAITDQPSPGGSGGVSTVTLDPAAYAGASLQAGVGDVGEGSFLAAGGGATLLAIAGGGGGAGYAGYFDLPGQILAVYPGGDGGAPAAPGVAAGGDAAAFGTLAANGKGGTSAGGTGGTGAANGTAGGSTTAVNPVALAAGGVGGSLVVGETTHVGGAGGTGYTGGGGGAVQRNVPNGDVPVDLAAPGGGGSGYLADGLTAAAQDANTGAGYVTFTWSLPPLSSPSPSPSATSPALAATGSDAALPASIAGILLLVGAAIIGTVSVSAVRRRRATR